MTCPTFAQTVAKIRSNQPCAVFQTCYYNVRLSVITLFLLNFFFSSSLLLFLINKIEISLLPLFYTFYCIVNN